MTPGGSLLWSRRFGGAAADYGAALTTDSSGNVYLTGTFSTLVDLGGGTLTAKGGGDFFLASFTASVGVPLTL